MREKYACSPNAGLFLLLTCISCILVLAGCSKKETEDKSKELVLLCGSSFPKPMEQLCAEFQAQTGIQIPTTTAGSEDFLPLVKAGQKGDILVTHDPYLDYVRDANALFDSIHAGFVAPVLAVQKGNPKGLSSIQDLTQPRLKVEVCSKCHPFFTGEQRIIDTAGQIERFKKRFKIED